MVPGMNLMSHWHPPRLLLPALCLLIWLNAAAVSAASLEWNATANHRFATVHPAKETRVGFTPMPPATTGVGFTNVLPAERHHTNQILLNGSGVTAGDVDGDGACDLFLCGLGGRSTLYRNLGSWQFRDFTREANLDFSTLDATGAALVDFDGDGDLDLIVNSVGQGTRCFLNDGQGRFASSNHPVLNQWNCGSSLALADIDGDGTLDLYVANYRTSTIRDQPDARFTIRSINGRPQPVAFSGRPLVEPGLTNRFAFRFRPAPGGGGSVFHDELGEADALYRNVGGGFAPVSFTNGTFLDEGGAALEQAPFDWGLSVMLRDFNGDGAPDIYVCNDFSTPDRFWINDGKGRFRAAPMHAVRQTSLSTMAIDVADINRDGFDDFFTADMLSREHWRRLVQRNEPNANIHLFVDIARRPQSARNTLQLGRGDGTYAEIAQLAGLESAEWAWASIFLDVDLDGFEDLLVANGFERDYMNMDANRRVKEQQMRAGRPLPAADQLGLNRLYPRLATTNLAFRNLGNLRFADVSAQWGFNVAGVSQGMCLADLDNDGDLDVVLNNSNDAATLLRNDTTAPRVAVRLKGRAPNTRGIGAKIKLLSGAVPQQSQEMICGGRYLSSDDSMRVFAAGSTTNRTTLVVTWRSGARSVVTNVQPNRIYEIDEATSGPPLNKPSSSIKPLFRDVSARLGHGHKQEPFDDFARQPLLPNKISTLGPGVTWFDVDGDSRDDLIIAGGKGEKMAVFRNDGGGAFSRLAGPHFAQALGRGQTTVLGWRATNGQAVLVAGSSNYEDGLTNGGVAQEFGLHTEGAKIEESLPGPAASTGPMALADVDDDGDLDLFVGGRVLPGRWPEAGPSRLFRRTGDKWLEDAENTQRLAGAGLVSGAVFTDLDGDGHADLVLACEWGPPRVFRNERGLLNDATSEWGLASFTGWWNGVSAGDFDGDGRMDLAVSNWGSNTKYERHRSKPVRLLYGDFNGDGTVALMEACHDEALNQYVPIHNVWTMSRGLPWLLEKFATYESFSRAGVEEALAEKFRLAAHREAARLESTVFLNRGGRFEARVLPVEAQLAPAFGVCVADFDGDGSEDIFLSQNFFGTRPETSRYDAGRGLLLRGDGRGEFKAVPGQESGLLIYGEQRGAAAGDYDGDGRVDLAVAQFAEETRLYHNETARPGLRVRLQGPPGNPHGVGANVRLKAGDHLGPAREVHAGSGYWSQDSAVQVMSAPGASTELLIHWPGGRTVTVGLPPGATEVSVDTAGNLRRATGK